MTDLEQELTDHLRQRAGAVVPRHDLQAVERGVRAVAVLHRDGHRSGRSRSVAIAGAVAAAVIGVVAVVALDGHDGRSTITGVDETAVTSPTVPTSSAVTSPTVPTSGGMWPQGDLDAVRAAQALADAGDPAATWQIEPELATDEWWAHLRDPGAEIAERFLREVLGWDHVLFDPYAENGSEGGVIRDVVYLRCGPGDVNPLYPVAPSGHQEAPGAERCAPTLDRFRYEAVRLDLAQLERRGPDGVWVVSRWAMTPPVTQVDPAVVESQATEHLEEFLRARIAGAGAEGFVEVERSAVDDDVPLLYATSAGSPYERYELVRLGVPTWPNADMQFVVRLVADGGRTVVEQTVEVWNVAGQLRYWHDRGDTSENGEAVAVRYSLLDDAVTLSAARPWALDPFSTAALVLGDRSDGRVQLVADPFPVLSGCERGDAPGDAASLAAVLASDSDLVVSAPVPVVVGGLDGVQLDVAVAPTAAACADAGLPLVLTADSECCSAWAASLALDPGARMRLTLVDLPEGSAQRVLAIAVSADGERFDAALDAAAPVVDTIALRPGS